MNQVLEKGRCAIVCIMSGTVARLAQLALLCILAVFPMAVVQAASGQDKLQDFFQGLESLTADFEQVLVGEGGQVLQQSSGTLFIQRPGKFRWNYGAPNRQVLVADGAKLWHYDPDLEQVTVRPLDETIGNTPAMLLSGRQAPEENFVITDLGDKDGLDWIELRPRDADLSVERVQIGFAGDVIRTMEIHDSLRQVTRLHFDNVKRNVPIDPGQFVFVPPAGVDVVGDQG